MASSNHPMDPSVIEAANGRIQIGSANRGRVGLLVEREDLYGGVLLTREQAQNVAQELLRLSAVPSPT